MFIERLKGISQASGNEKVAIVTTAVVILALIVDMELSNVADILHKSVASGIGFIVFITISIIYLSGQHLLVRFAKAKTLSWGTKKERDANVFLTLFLSNRSNYYFCFFVLVILEMQLEGYYGMVSPPMTIIMSNGLTAWIMFNLSKRLYVSTSPINHTMLSSDFGYCQCWRCISIYMSYRYLVLSTGTIIAATTPVIVHSFNPDQRLIS